MITHKISKPGIVRAFVGNIFNNGQTKPPHINQRALTTNKMFQKMGKMEFSKWLEKNVCSTYVKGDRLTFATTPTIPNQAPPVVYELIYINELWYNNEWDDVVKEPACLSVRSINGVVLSKCPSIMRKLTEEELNLVNLSNTPPQGNA